MIGTGRLIGYAAAAVTVLAIVVITVAAWSRIWSWLPWSAESRAERAESRAAVAEDTARSAVARADGEVQVGRAIERQTIIIREAASAAYQSELTVRTAPDADTPFDPDRARRIHDAQRSLCLAAPTVCTAASPDPADG